VGEKWSFKEILKNPISPTRGQFFVSLDPRIIVQYTADDLHHAFIRHT